MEAVRSPAARMVAALSAFAAAVRQFFEGYAQAPPGT
jgi:hypothetical protein